MAKKGRKSRKVSAKSVRSSLIKLRSQATPRGKKLISAVVKAITKDCTDGTLGNRFFATKAGGRKRK